MPTSPRRRYETILLAVVAVGSVLPMRYPIESPWWCLGEFGFLGLMAAVTESVRRPVGRSPRLQRLRGVAATCLLFTPILFAVLARFFRCPVAIEMSALSTFGAMALLLSLIAADPRTQAMSLVSSGFLSLFSTSISDDPRAVLLAVAWMTLCVWHLVANHWEKLDVCMPDSVQRTVAVRPASVLLAVGLCVAVAWMVGDRVRQSDRLSLGWMPTSGGSKWSDPAARSGIGTGEAAIAAKDHAESFGAVESEIFLESTESTLFDMFNDSIGEPKRNKQFEMRQGLNNQNVIPMHQRAAKSERGGSSFSTDRMPPKQQQRLTSVVDDAVIQWAGPTGIRLAMERFDTFDGVDWTNTAKHADTQLQRVDIADRVWFFDRMLKSLALADQEAVSVDLLKVLRLSSTRLPAPMMTAGLHIKDIDRQDFFAIDDDGSLFMPGRQKVPPLTVVNLASLKIMEDELLQGIAVRNAGDTSRSQPDRYQQLRAIVDDLRTRYTFDRNAVSTSDDPVGEFLRTRRGGDHLFATVAALKARQIGLRSRIVTGFYVRPGALDLAAGHASIAADDVHVWVEIALEDGRWFEIEPTPGYREPVYRPSWWLVTKRFAATHWITGVIAAGGCGVLLLTRVVWIQWLLAAGWSLSWLLSRRRQLRLALRIVEIRARLIGRRRPAGMPQRDWLESLASRDSQLRQRVGRFCDDADRSVFGIDFVIDRPRMNDVVRGLTAKSLKRLTTQGAA